MQRSEGKLEKRDIVESAVFMLTAGTLFGWLMHRGNYVMAFLVLTSLVAVDTVIMTSRWDWALVLRHGGDERQQRVSDRAGRSAFLAVLLTCLAGASWEMERGGDPGPFALIAGIAIAAYLVSVAILVRRS